MKIVHPFLFLLSLALVCILFYGTFSTVPAAAGAAKAQEEGQPYTPVQTSPMDLDLIEVGVVKEVLKADMIQLDSGKIYLLDNIRTPPQYSTVTSDYLAKKLTGKEVGIFTNASVKDRKDEHGTPLAHVQMKDGTWVQEDMVANGYAWADSTPVSRDLVFPLYKAEIAARNEKRGFWSYPQSVVRNDLNIHADINSFQVFDGVIRKVDGKISTIIFYFGDDPTTDFSLYLDTENQKYFRIAGEQMSFKKFKNVRIRVRGWVFERYGPAMYLTHPEQIEFPDFENVSRAVALKASHPPPLMPYDALEAPKDTKKK